MTRTHRWWSVAAASFALFVFAAGLPASARADWFMNKVVEAEAKFVDVFNDRDAAALAGLYSRNASLMPPGSARIVGREAIQNFWQGLFDIGEVELSLTAFMANNNGTLGYSIGGYSLTIMPEGAEAIADEGKYVIVWKRGPTGIWQLAVDIWNTDLAPPE